MQLVCVGELRPPVVIAKGLSTFSLLGATVA
jgi:hypothetical protein